MLRAKKDDVGDDGETYEVVPGFLHRLRGTGEKRLRVWCMYCCVWHTHGDDPVGSVEHRAAHCFAPDSEYRLGGGYLIQVSARSFTSVRGKVRKATQPQIEQIRAGEITPEIAALRAQSPPAA